MPLAYVSERAHREQGRRPVPLHRDKVEECPWKRQLSLIASLSIQEKDKRGCLPGVAKAFTILRSFTTITSHSTVDPRVLAALLLDGYPSFPWTKGSVGIGLSDVSPRTTPRFEALNMRETVCWTCRDRGCVVGRVACSNSARYSFLDSSANWMTTRMVSKHLPGRNRDQTSASNLGLMFINLHLPVSGIFSRLGSVGNMWILLVQTTHWLT